jgi:hypothetical protein
VTTSAAAEHTRVQALLEAAPKRNAALPGAPLVWDAMVADLLHQAVKKSQENLELQAWAALDV